MKNRISSPLELLKQRLVEYMINGKFVLLYWTGDPNNATRELTADERKLLATSK